MKKILLLALLTFSFCSGFAQDFSFDELVQLHQKAGLEVINVYGDYGLGDFKTNSSPRIVLVSRKS